MQDVQKPVGNPFLWCLIPLGLSASVFGVVAARKARIDGHSSHDGSRSHKNRSSDNSRYS